MVDYKGQALAERYMVLVFLVVCTPAWIYGYLQQDFTYPLHAWLAATAIAALVRAVLIVPAGACNFSLTIALWRVCVRVLNSSCCRTGGSTTAIRSSGCRAQCTRRSPRANDE